MKLTEDYLNHLHEVDPLQMAQVGVSAMISGRGGFKDAMKMLKVFCNDEYANDPQRLKRCMSLKYTPGGITYGEGQKLLPPKFKFKPPGVKDKDLHKYKPGRAEFKPMKVKQESAEAQLAMAGGLAAGAVATTLIAWAHKKYEDWYGRANKACGKLKGSEGRLCRQNFKVQAAKAEIQALKYSRSKCARAKDRKLCIQKINDRIKKLKDKFPDIEYTMKAIAKHKQEAYYDYEDYDLVQEIEDILNGEESLEELNEFFRKKPKGMIGAIKDHSVKIYKQCKKANKGRYARYDIKVVCLEAKTRWTIKGIKNCKYDTNPDQCKKVIEDYIEDLKMEYTSAKHEAFRKSGGSYFD